LNYIYHTTFVINNLLDRGL